MLNSTPSGFAQDQHRLRPSRTVVSMILDACALLWLAQGSSELTEAAIQKIKEARVVYVCAISGPALHKKSPNRPPRSLRSRLPLCEGENDPTKLSCFIHPLAEGESRPARSAAAGG